MNAVVQDTGADFRAAMAVNAIQAGEAVKGKRRAPAMTAMQNALIEAAKATNEVQPTGPVFPFVANLTSYQTLSVTTKNETEKKVSLRDVPLLTVEEAFEILRINTQAAKSVTAAAVSLAYTAISKRRNVVTLAHDKKAWGEWKRGIDKEYQSRGLALPQAWGNYWSQARAYLCAPEPEMPEDKPGNMEMRKQQRPTKLIYNRDGVTYVAGKDMLMSMTKKLVGKRAKTPKAERVSAILDRVVKACAATPKSEGVIAEQVALSQDTAKFLLASAIEALGVAGVREILNAQEGHAE